MDALIRTRVSRFELADSLTLDEVRKAKEEGTLSEHLIAIDDMFPQFPRIFVTKTGSALVHNGNPFTVKEVKDRVELSDGEKFRVYDDEGRFIAVYSYQKNKSFKIVKMFYDGNN